MQAQRIPVVVSLVVLVLVAAGLALANGGPFVVTYPGGDPAAKGVLARLDPSLKPQSFLRRLVYAALPLGQGVVADPFMGSGSTIAACEALHLQGIGVERQREYFEMAKQAIPRLKKLETDADEIFGAGKRLF